MIKSKAIIKWFNDSKGYGFVSVADKDIFCHYSSIPGTGFKTLSEGQVIVINYIEGPQGPQVVEVLELNPVY
jgi:CspA family cold shock protein